MNERKPYSSPQVHDVTDPKTIHRIVEHDIATSLYEVLKARRANPIHSFSALGALAVGFARGLMVSREQFLDMMGKAYDASVGAKEPT